MVFAKGNKLKVVTGWRALFAKVSILLCGLILLIYWSYLYLSPSLTISNQSAQGVESAVVKLPHSRLDFGDIAAMHTNTLYYDLAQLDGAYRYHIELDSGEIIAGECGYITNFEIHKRVVITISEAATMSCSVN
ncbi:hypothetical protein ACFL6Z_06490 [Pseudomonadota bacterium]|uniref:hypothetical protein n=1 Tax=unclassified Shewanella TaxID=196818 RepID=UPI000C865A76|nr:MULTISPECIES: hypothetical protein [unclassified Shewanella]MDO6776732.1 hypothetical protein [Shewanella sp. 3_MG-2023]PMH87413.1 hypothetical protein BCU57_07160 [Shewanella sp. 10N.286.48.B5]PMI03420.1 hypothetical protein BCU55_00270 [Shewanella sp. 10N.286.48.A6]